MSLQFGFTRELADQHVKEKENGIFECDVTHKKMPVDWFVKDTKVVPGPKYQVFSEEFTHRLCINIARPVDEGQVKAVFRKAVSQAKLFVERKYLLNITFLKG